VDSARQALAQACDASAAAAAKVTVAEASLESARTVLRRADAEVRAVIRRKEHCVVKRSAVIDVRRVIAVALSARGCPRKLMKWIKQNTMDIVGTPLCCIELSKFCFGVFNCYAVSWIPERYSAI
jgi:hypothetical protein